MPGVLKFITAEDIPGVNNFVGALNTTEKIFCDEEVEYAGQGVGVIIAGNMSVVFAFAFYTNHNSLHLHALARSRLGPL